MPKTHLDTTVTHAAGEAGFNYYGRWHRGRRQALTINSGALVEFAYSGGACTLVFDVASFTHYPGILVQVDDGPVVKTQLSAETNTVPVTPAYDAVPAAGTPPFETIVSGHHLVRFWTACHSLYLTPAAGKQWGTQVGGGRFLGVNLNGGSLTALPYQARQLEFLGDSITQGLRLLYTRRDVGGVEPDIGNQMPPLNWPQLVANLLGMKPVVTGFGGQGLSSPGTCGAPVANTAFRFVCDGTEWRPVVEPSMVVIYHGTNDGIAPAAFQDLYVTYLQTIRTAYPTAAICAVCPHNITRYATAIAAAVTTVADRGTRFLDYSTGVIAAAETCDGCHLNPGGAMRLALRLAPDLAEAMGILDRSDAGAAAAGLLVKVKPRLVVHN